MTTLSQSRLHDLAERREDAVVSILLPTEMAGKETRKNPIRFKNLVSDAEKRLEASSDSEALLEQLKKHCEPRIEDHEFWQHQLRGLGVLCDRERCEFVHLPIEPEEWVAIGDRFHIKPLLPIVARNQPFYLLALSGNECRVYHGDSEKLEEVQVEGLPESLEHALRWDDPEKSLQFHTGAQSPSPGQPAMYHGHGAGDDEKKDRFLRYFQRCDRALVDFLNKEKLPLILATVDEHVPLYVDANSYHHLVEEHWVSGNPEDLGIDELHEQARQVADSLVENAEEKALEELREALGTDNGSRSLKEISPAIKQGRVAKLFIAADRRKPGHVDAVSGEVDLESDASEDVLNDIAAETLLMGGEVFVMRAERIPDGVDAAAIYRF